MATQGLMLALSLLLIFLLTYALIPDLLLHYLGFGSYRRQYSPGVVLTFDDGPDPDYTPRLLTWLKQEQVPAVFFLLAEKAEQHPELVQRIVQDGHQIGSHGYAHILAWRMTPGQTWKAWDRSMDILEKISGQKIQWIRPPHGVFSLPLWLWCRSRGKIPVLYNVKGKDWIKSRTSDQIRESVLRRTAPGSLILLHDSGGEAGAPENTLSALPALCQGIRQELKLSLVPLELPDWSFSRRLVFELWQRWEQFYARIFGVERLDNANLFRLSKRRYKGPDLYTPDGVLVAKKGDWIGEIHFESIRFQMDARDEQRIGLTALKRVRESLVALARFVEDNPEYRDIKVLAGVTFINRGARGLGFHVVDLPPSLSLRGIALMQQLIMTIYHPLGKARKRQRLGKLPKLVWITKEELLERLQSMNIS